VQPLVYGGFGGSKTTAQPIPQQACWDWDLIKSRRSLSHEISDFSPKNRSFSHCRRTYCWIAPAQPSGSSQSNGTGQLSLPSSVRALIARRRTGCQATAALICRAKRRQVLAAGNGVVTFAGLVAGKGVVVIKHGKLRTTYEPVTASVTVGSRVRVGDVIGTLSPGESHCSTQTTVSCLHWGLLRGEKYLNPLSLVQKRVRLLPTRQCLLAPKGLSPRQCLLHPLAHARGCACSNTARSRSIDTCV
jgi:hypothetical protein